jgi:hypothetical protein
MAVFRCEIPPPLYRRPLCFRIPPRRKAFAFLNLTPRFSPYNVIPYVLSFKVILSSSAGQRTCPTEQQLKREKGPESYVPSFLASLPSCSLFIVRSLDPRRRD